MKGWEGGMDIRRQGRERGKDVWNEKEREG